jgi:hypothetical protein
LNGTREFTKEQARVLRYRVNKKMRAGTTIRTRRSTYSRSHFLTSESHHIHNNIEYQLCSEKIIPTKCVIRNKPSYRPTII